MRIFTEVNIGQAWYLNTKQRRREDFKQMIRSFSGHSLFAWSLSVDKFVPHVKTFCLFSVSDWGGFRSRHRDGEILQHQMPSFRFEAQRGGAGCNCPSTEDARRRPECKFSFSFFFVILLLQTVIKCCDLCKHILFRSKWIISGLSSPTTWTVLWYDHVCFQSHNNNMLVKEMELNTQ